MLEQIMREVAEEAKESNRKATERYFEAMRRNALVRLHNIIQELELKTMIFYKCQTHFWGHYQKHLPKMACLQLFYP